MSNNILSDVDKYKVYKWLEDKHKTGVRYPTKGHMLADIKAELGLIMTVGNLEGAAIATGICLWDKKPVAPREDLSTIQNELALHKHVLKNIVLLMNKEGFEVSPEILNFCKSVQPPAAVQ